METEKYIYQKLCIIILIIIIFIIVFHPNNQYYISPKSSMIIEPNFEYNKYQKDIITEELYTKSGCELSHNQAYFLNGIIRKHKPKNCLEIGVSRGGSSILILNAIKDIQGSQLVSLDLYTVHYKDPSIKTGWRVNSFFPNLTKKWSLYTGDQPHKFLMKLNLKFDFLFLDTAHISPGELFNMIEAMPFLNENAIIVLHDIKLHCTRINKKNELDAKINPPNFHLMTFLYGDKILLKSSQKTIDNMGAIFLYKNQKSHYLEYFFSLISIWDYIPSDDHLKDMKNFIISYYQEESLVDMFNEAVSFNKAFFKKFNKTKFKFFNSL